MDWKDACEQAYRNGYNAGYEAAKKEIVRCAVCIHWGRSECPLVKDGEVIKNLGSGFYCRNGDRGE